jgi:hypothetical protein
LAVYNAKQQIFQNELKEYNLALVAYNESRRVYLAAVNQYQAKINMYLKEEAAYNATKAAYDSLQAKYAAELLEYLNAQAAYNAKTAKAAEEYQDSVKKYEAELQAYKNALALKQNYDNWAFSTKRASSSSPAIAPSSPPNIAPSYYSQRKSSSAEGLVSNAECLLYPLLVLFYN